MMKKILVACHPSQIDGPLRKCLAHLTQSCKITLARDGYSAFDEICAQAFDLIIIDSLLPGIDSLEVIEGIQYVDHGVPIILMLNQICKGVWDTVCHLEAHPITRPFKPLRFLRLVDKLLHQHLNHYRKLAERLTTNLETLRAQTNAPCTFLVEDSGQVLMASGEVAGLSLDSLGRLAMEGLARGGEVQPLLTQPETLHLYPQLARNHGVYVMFVAANLYLVLISAATADPHELVATWEQLDAAISQIKVAFYDQIRTDISSLGSGYSRIPQIFFPLAFTADNDQSLLPEDHDEIAVNWQILSTSSTILSRLDDFCRVP